MSCNEDGPLLLLHLPDLLLMKIMGYLSYNEIAINRILCCRFNDLNQLLLNNGFRQAEAFHLKCQKEVKNELPRRESERRDHPLAHHCNILSGIETRLSLLNMTFLKYIDAKLCCFIPGKVIDELFRVLRFVKKSKNIFVDKNTSTDTKNTIMKELRANVILKELRDISSMAMEHFEEHILPAYKQNSSQSIFTAYSSPSVMAHLPYISFNQPSTSSTPRILMDSPVSANSSLNSDHLQSLGSLKMCSKQNKNGINVLKKQVNNLQNRLNEANRKIGEQEQVILELNRVLTEQTSKLSDQDNKFLELNRKLVSNEQKLTTLMRLVSGGPLSTEALNSALNSSSSLVSQASSQNYPSSSFSLHPTSMVPVESDSIHPLEGDTTSSCPRSRLSSPDSSGSGSSSNFSTCVQISSDEGGIPTTRSGRKRKSYHQGSSVKSKRLK